MPNQAMSRHETRSEPRDEVMHRTRAADSAGTELRLTLVNVSPSGLMARCDGDLDAGERLHVRMPIVGDILAHVRWSLGGRIGCAFDRTIPPKAYYGMLAAMLRTG
ncbi:PilZ domain-containing protein [Sphingomonas sp. CFBP 13714]|uniref:PilZ domain-containing protein n=1 Tax=Sphingomonas sp. CFBP 13714 TaxID=2775308 RepID=UPI001785E73C|nr:PilZ domain-containing protein [Sphingomonas sp. CFBP 13714]MBD8701727.1 PilZ domain-containing protein [Sphingomonas sp. CFBP 13714]